MDHRHLVYTGPIDVFFGYRFGELPYRSLEWELRNEPTPDGGLVLPAALGQLPVARTCRTRASPSSGGSRGSRPTRARRSPWSSRARRATRTTRSRATTRGRSTSSYETLAAELPDVTFVGRLARYQYLNMDQVVGQALSTFAKLVERGVGRAAVETPV